MLDYLNPLRRLAIISCYSIIFHSYFVSSQCPVSAPPDETITCGGSTSLVAPTDQVNYEIVTTSCTPIPITGTNAFPTACDDCVTGQIPIGFSFDFYGNTYTDAVIQSNGIVGFGPFTFTGYNSFSIPAGGDPNNYIAGFFADIDIRYGGTITYQTIGTAPNRQFVVSYDNVVPYDLGTGAGTGTASFQIVLNEDGSFYVIISQLSANWYASTSEELATSGAENDDGTYAFPVPGRNATDWPGIVPGDQDCHLFNPQPCIFQRWEVGGSSVSTNPTYNVSPAATTTYTAIWNCGLNVCTDDVTITVPTAPTTTNASMCQGGTATLTSSACGVNGTPVASGGTFNSGSLTSSDPTWDRNNGGTTCNGSGSGTDYYDVYAFTVTTSGSYTLTGCFASIDGHASLYQNAFDGANPCGTPSNFIIANDDSAPGCGGDDPQLVATLNTGVIYYIISTTFSGGVTGDYSWTFTGPGSIVPTTGGVVQWYTAPTGGTAIGTGSPFNPVGVAGSGIATSSSTGTYTFYAACSTAPTCRTATTFTISPNSTPPTSISGTGNICQGTSATLSVVGGSLATGAQWEWFTGSCGGTPAGTGPSITVSPTTTTTYYVRASAGSGCAPTACTSGTVTLPPAGTNLANNNETATCIVNQNGYVHFYHSSGRLIASINSFGQNLGNVTATAYTGTPVDMPACVYPASYMTTAMGRRWVITPEFQPASPIDVVLPFDQTEFDDLQTVANANSSAWDDVYGINDLLLSKYPGPNNVDNTPLNNCPAAGGNGGTTLHNQVATGNTNAIIPGFSATSRYSRHSIPGFSEFWLHGSTVFSPLSQELIAFSATCTSSHSVKIVWATASETNCASFIVEKSTGDGNWEHVETVTCSVNQDQETAYMVTDINRMEGLSYYRLSEQNLNGTTTILRTITVSCNSSNLNFSVFPNPAQNSFSVQVSTDNQIENAQIIITDLSGKIVDKRRSNLEPGNTTLSFDAQQLGAGTYLISVQNQEEHLKPVKIIIQH